MIKRISFLLSLIMTGFSVLAIVYGVNRTFILSDVEAKISESYVKKMDVKMIEQKIDLTREDISDFRKETREDLKEIRDHIFKK